jgi:hypothetical protein
LWSYPSRGNGLQQAGSGIAENLAHCQSRVHCANSHGIGSLWGFGILRTRAPHLWRRWRDGAAVGSVSCDNGTCGKPADAVDRTIAAPRNTTRSMVGLIIGIQVMGVVSSRSGTQTLHPNADSGALRVGSARAGRQQNRETGRGYSYCHSLRRVVSISATRVIRMRPYRKASG